MFKIVIVEDDISLAQTVVEYLEMNNYKITHFRDGSNFVNELKLYSYDLILLDLMMENLGGFEVLSYLKEIQSKTPIIVISGSLELDNLEYAFKLGAVDYIKKPVHLRELLARIKRFDVSEDKLFFSATTYFDKKNGILYKNNQPVEMSQKPTAILSLFCKNPNQLLTYELIEASIWHSQSEIKLNTITTYIRDLNKLISPANIKNISKTGYRLVIEH